MLFSHRTEANHGNLVSQGWIKKVRTRFGPVSLRPCGALAARLADPSMEVRIAVAEALCRIDRPEAALAELGPRPRAQEFLGPTGGGERPGPHRREGPARPRRN